MGAMGGHEPADSTEMLVHMQVSMKQMGTNVTNVGKKLDEAMHGIKDLELNVAKIQQLHVIKENEPAPSLLDIENMMKKVMGSQGGDVALQEPSAARHAQEPSLAGVMQRVEEGFGEVLQKIVANEVVMESKAGKHTPPNDSVLSEMRSDFVAFQAALTNEFKTQKESILHELQNIAAKSKGGQDPPPDDSKVADEMQGIPRRSRSRGRMDVDLLKSKSSVDVDDPKLAQGLLQPKLADDPPVEPVEVEDVHLKPLSSDLPANSQESFDLLSRSPSKREIQDEVDLLAVDVDTAAAEELDGFNPTFKEGDGMAACFTNDDDVEAPQYHVEEYYKKTGCAQRIARSVFFQNLTVAIVAWNAIHIGVDSDWNDASNIYAAHPFFLMSAQIFCVYFTWELIVRFFAFERKRDCLRDGWFKFDAFLVATMIADVWLIMPILYDIGGKVKIPTQPLRMLRLFKLTRMARLMKAFPELVTMIKGLLRSLRAISSSMILIGLMVYVWGIMMHMLMKSETEFNKDFWDEYELGFASLIKCIWSLLMAGTLMLDNASPLMKRLIFGPKINYVLAGVAFLAYALLSALLILQMLIGVLCDVVARVGQEQRDANAVGLVKQELLANLKKYDNGDGQITQEELLVVMNEPKSRAVLKKLNINRAFVLELQKMMFTHVGQRVPIKAVLQLMVMCQGWNTATVESVSGGILAIIHELSALRRQLERDLEMIQKGEKLILKEVEHLEQMELEFSAH